MPMPSSKAFEALQKGMLDVAAMDPVIIKTYGWHEVTKGGYIIQLGGWEAGNASFEMHKPTWDSMPGDLQKILSDTVKELLLFRYVEEIDARAGAALQEIVDYGCTKIVWSDEEQQRLFNDYAKPLWEARAKELDAQGLPGTEAMEAWWKGAKELYEKQAK